MGIWNSVVLNHIKDGRDGLIGILDDLDEDGLRVGSGRRTIGIDLVGIIGQFSANRVFGILGVV